MLKKRKRIQGAGIIPTLSHAATMGYIDCYHFLFYPYQILNRYVEHGFLLDSALKFGLI
jgi:hypothetical protein